ncbi:MAG TPA: helix-turn-helix domain-containing protein [Nitrososphaeraceae archaeon]|jgi:predicted transcriptional regulator
MHGTPISTITRLNSTAKDLFIYLYDLSPLDADLFFMLMKSKKPVILEDLARKINRDKSNVFRSVQKLVSSGICIKETRTIKDGGYYHIYSAVDTKTFKMETEKRVKELQASFERILRKFEEDIQNMVSSF